MLLSSGRSSLAGVPAEQSTGRQGRPNGSQLRQDRRPHLLPNATIPGGYDVVTDLSIYDTTRTAKAITTETYDGRAVRIYGVPRDQRHASGTQTVRYRSISHSCHGHTLSAINGVYTTWTRNS